MGKSENKDSSKYCYGVALEAIQYSDDLKVWSPNNIRRLIISPDGVAVQLHTGKAVIQKPFNPTKAGFCFSDIKYKPMITTLVNRVCSSIEEVVFCTGSRMGLCLPQSELELRSILASTKVSTTEAELLKNIADRFVRLRGILVFSCTVSEFLQKYGNYMSDHMFQLCDTPSVRTEARIVDVHINDWHKGYYLRPRDYLFDKEGGALYNTLHKIEDIIEKNKREKAVSENKNKLLKEYVDKVKTSELKALRVLRAYKDVASLVMNCSVICICSDSFRNDKLASDILSIVGRYSFTDSESILSKEFKDLVVKYGAKVSNNKSGDTREGIKVLIMNLDALFLDLYVSICDNFLDIVLLNGRKYPIMTKIKLNKYDRVIYIPPQLVDKANSVTEFFNSPLSGSSIKDSLANICCLVSFLLLSDSDSRGVVSSVKKYYKKQTWLDKYKDLEVIKNA